MSVLDKDKPKIVVSRPRAYSYLRFSTPEQAAGDSFRRQAEAAAAYAKQHGLELDTSLTFRDLGVSAYRGTNAEAGRLADFLEAVRAGQIERGSWLLVESLDRLSRMSPRRASRVLESIIDEGITVVTMTDGKVYTAENIDADQITFLLAILTFMRAHEESATKGRRVRAAWDNKRATARPGADRPYTRQAPAWLSWNADHRRWELIEERAVVLRRIFMMAYNGKGQHAIARHLDDCHVMPWGRAKSWHRSYIKKLLANDAVLGTLRPHTRDYDEATGRSVRTPQGAPIQDYYPAAIDIDVWQQVQTLAASRGRTVPTTARRPGLVVHALAGLAKCSCCGATMTRVFKGRRGGKPKLVCVVAKKRGRGSCRYRAVNVGDVEAALYADLPRILAEAPLADGFADDRLREIDAALSGLDDVIGDAEGRPRSAANAALKRQLTSVKAGLVAERASVVRALDERTDAVVQARFDALREALSTRDVVQVNAALGRVFSRVIIDPDAGMLRFVWSHGDGAESATMYKFPGVATRH